MTITKQEILEDCVAKVNGCGSHESIPWNVSDVAEIIAAYTSRSNRGDTEASSCVLVRLASGRFGVAMESEDYTGHG